MRPGAGLTCEKDRTEWCTDHSNPQFLARVNPHKRRSGPAELAPTKKAKSHQIPAITGFLAEIIEAVPEEYTQAREELLAHLLSLVPVTPSPFFPFQ